MSKIMDNWAAGKPIYDLLPKLQNAYLSPVNEWVLDYWDSAFMNAADQLVNLREYFNPTTCPAEWLDLIAPCFGFSAPYYSKSWPVASKRLILANAFTAIWPFIGQPGPFLFIADALGYLVRLRIPGDFILSGPFDNPVVLGSQLDNDQMGSRGWEADILIPTEYADQPAVLAAIDQLVYLYLPAYLQIQYVYTDQPFYLTLLTDSDNSIILIDSDNNALRLD